MRKLKTPLTSEELKVLEQLSLYPGARFCYQRPGTQQAGNYILNICFEESHSSAALDYGKDGGEPEIVPKKIVEKLIRLGMLKRSNKGCQRSVFGHKCMPNPIGLKNFEQTKEIAVQIALGTWYKEADSDWKDLGE